MAWLKRKAWGNYRLYAVRDDGQPATQADCERELGIDKRRISHVVDYYEKRGYLRRKMKLLYPVIAPQLGPLLEKVAHSPDFFTFLETWKVAQSSDFQEMEVARSTVKRIGKVLLSDYKKWRASATIPAPSLMRDRESLREEESSVDRSASPPSTPATAQAEEPTDRPTENPFKTRIGEWLRAMFTHINFPLEETVLDQIAATIHTEANFEQFQKAAAKGGKQARGWHYFVTTAESCVPNQAAYERTMAAGAAACEESPRDRAIRVLGGKTPPRGNTNG